MRNMENRNFISTAAFAGFISLSVGFTPLAMAIDPADQPSEIYAVNKHTKRMIDIYSACEFLDFATGSGGANVANVDLSEVQRVCDAGIDTAFNIVAVSGTLEEGFPLRKNLDYEPGTPNQVLSTFLGKALVRGLRANLDIKGPGWREFKPFDINGCLAGLNADPALDDVSKCQSVNPGMVATGIWNDANIYSVYLIDRRQAVRALLNEPRFLSMTPDLALVDIKASETSADVRKLVLQGIKSDSTLQNPKNKKFATLLTVVSTWHSCYFEPSPVLYTKSDGTRVTDFPNSLAAFASTMDVKRASAALGDRMDYYGAVDNAIKNAIDMKTATCDPISQPPQ